MIGGSAVSRMASSPWPGQASGKRIVVGIGDLALSHDPLDTVMTFALGSCIAVCLWDPYIGAGGLLHFLLPDSRINPTRAKEQPSAFADTGIPLFFQSAYALGCSKQRCIVHLIGGADVTGVGASGSFNIGKRNILAAKSLLWRNGVLIKGEAVGAREARTVALSVGDGRISIKSGRNVTSQL